MMCYGDIHLICYIVEQPIQFCIFPITGWSTAQVKYTNYI